MPHPGLNILPQKSWNVYGRENRLKVSRDEAKHAEEQRLKAEKQRLVSSLYLSSCTRTWVPFPVLLVDAQAAVHPAQAESEVRRAFLLRQAALKRGEAPEEEQAQLATPPEQPAAQGGLLLQHINFFQEHEAHELNPEVRAMRSAWAAPAVLFTMRMHAHAASRSSVFQLHCYSIVCALQQGHRRQEKTCCCSVGSSVHIVCARIRCLIRWWRRAARKPGGAATPPRRPRTRASTSGSSLGTA